MGTRKVYDLAVKVSSYTNEAGETKNRYQNVGAVMQRDDGGKFLMLAKWFNPAGVADERGGESILISMFEPKDKQGSSDGWNYAPKPSIMPPPPPAQAQLGDGDEIPF